MLLNSNGVYLFQFSRQFYIAQWYRDASVEVEKLTKQQARSDPDEVTEEYEKANEVLQSAEARKQLLFEHINTKVGMFATYK